MKIEQGIPIPPKTGGRPRSEPAELATRMKVGDSLLCPTRASFEAVRAQIRRLGWKYQCRKVAEGECRVWRIE